MPCRKTARDDVKEHDPAFRMLNDVNVQAGVGLQPHAQPEEQILIALALDGIGIKRSTNNAMGETSSIPNRR